MSVVQYAIRLATLQDIPELQTLIARSARELSTQDYTPEQVDGALKGAFGVDTQLIKDGTYFVVERDGELAGCGGWSFRRTLFGSDQRKDREAGELDPATDAAKIRAFFVHPLHARNGVGRLLLEHCEREARQRGFKVFELMSTLPGMRLYSRMGYLPKERVHYPVGDGVTIEFVPMMKHPSA